MISAVTLGVFLLCLLPAYAEEDLYDYDSINPFREIERISRQSSHNEQSQDAAHSHHHTMIQELTVQCSQSGLSISVEFDSPFDGVIYSKGYFSEKKCRFVEARTGSTKYSFEIPAGQCGTQLDQFSRTISNTLIFQMDESVQEVWDIAKKLSCKYQGAHDSSSTKQSKMVVFKPLSVGMLTEEHEPFNNGVSGGLDCWMDILKGTFPNTKPIGGQIEIGEELSVVIYLKDEERQYDVSVKDCWAYDSEKYTDPETTKLQLTGDDGCPRKPKLIGRWMKTFETGGTGATTIAFTNLTAFKFPESDSIYLTCNIELCKDVCEDTCGSVAPAPSKPFVRPRPGVTTARPAAAARPRPTSAPVRERCFPGSNDPACFTCTPGSQDPRCPKSVDAKQYNRPGPVTAAPECYEGSRDPRCRSTQQKTEEFNRVSEPQCYPGSRDPSCRQTVAPTNAPYQRPTSSSKAPLCYPGAVDPRCPPDCSGAGAYSDPRCAQPETTKRYTQGPTPAPAQITTRAPLCYPGSVDPRCPPDCSNTGAFSDPRCRQETTARYNAPTTARPTSRYTPSATTRQPDTQPPRQTTGKPPLCYPGAIDPRCPPDCTRAGAFQDPRCKTDATTRYIPTTTARYTQPYTQPPRTTTSKPPLCYPGAVDPRCPPDCSGTGAIRDPRCKPETTTRYTPPATTRQPPTSKAPLCYPGAVDQRCPPDCSNTGAFSDPRCRQETTTRYTQPPTTRPTTRYTPPPTTRYTQPATTRQPQTQPPRTTTGKPPLCYPGAVDPRCPPDCSNTGAFQDPRCKQETTTRYTPPATTRTTIRYTPPATTRQPQTQPALRTTTAKPPLCYPGAVDPRCPQDCSSEGAFRDPRCKPETTTIRYTPPATTRSTQPATTRQPPQPTTSRPTLCYPGAVDPRCPPDCASSGTFRDPRCQTEATTRYTPPATTRYTPTTRQPQTQPPRTTTKAPLCYPGAVDPRCPPDCSNTGAFSDPRCRKEETTRYTQTTTTRPTTRYTPPATARYTPPATTRQPQTQPPRVTTTSKPPLCYPGAVDPRCPPDCFNTGAFRDPRCKTEATTRYTPPATTRYTPPPTTRQPQTQTPRPTTGKPPLCYPGAVDPRCPPDCSNTGAFSDPRCRKETTTRYTQPQTTRPTTRYTPPATTRAPQVTTSKTRYTPTVTTRYTQPVTTRKPQTQPPRVSTSKPPLCYPGAVDPRCPPDCSSTGAFRDPRCKTESTTRHTPPATTRYTPLATTRPPQTQPPRQASTKAPLCYPGAVDPRCPPDCSNTGAFQDPRCRKDTTTRYTPPPTTRPTTRYTPPATTRYTPPATTRPPQSQPPRVTTSKPPLCYPGAVDPRCPPDCSNTGAFRDPRCKQETTTRYTPPATTRYTQPTTTRSPQTQPSRVTTGKPPLCYPGAVDPRCPPDCSNTGAFSDPRCRKETTTRYTPPPTTTRPTTRYTPPATTRYTPPATSRAPQTQPPRGPTSKPLLCYPGAVDPRCPPDCSNTGAFRDPRCKQEATTRYTQPQTTRTPQTQPPRVTTGKPPLCYPGAVDPRCPPDCSNTGAFSDPRCRKDTTTRYTPPPTTRPTTRYTPPATTRYTPPATTRPPQTQPPRGTTSKPPLCYPGAVDPRCPPDCSNTGAFRDPRCKTESTTRYTTPAPQTTRPTTRYTPPVTTRYTPPVSTSTRPPQTQPPRVTTSKPPLCYPGAVDPRCPPDCSNTGAFRDPRCKQETTTRYSPPPTTRPTTRYTPPVTTRYTPPATTRQPPTTSKAPLCYPGAVDPRCPPDCSNTGAFRDPRCKAETTTRYAAPVTTRYTPPPTTRPPQTQPPRPTTTSKAPLCYPGAIDPRCPPDCSNTGAFRDPRCKVETTTRYTAPVTTTTRYTQPPTTRPPQTQPPRVTTSKPPLCYPGAVDPRCPPDCSNTGAFRDPRCKVETTTRYTAPVTTRYSQPPTTRPPQTQPPRPTTTNKPPLCYPGAVDPRCPPDCSNTGAFRDPRCKVESITRYTPPATTRYTQPPTTRQPYTQPPRPITTSKPPLCYPGAVDPRCPPDCTSQGEFRDPRCPPLPQKQTTPSPQTTRPPLCYPGAIDPRCPPDCSNNGAFKDPRCRT